MDFTPLDFEFGYPMIIQLFQLFACINKCQRVSPKNRMVKPFLSQILSKSHRILFFIKNDFILDLVEIWWKNSSSNRIISTMQHTAYRIGTKLQHLNRAGMLFSFTVIADAHSKDSARIFACISRSSLEF